MGLVELINELSKQEQELLYRVLFYNVSSLMHPIIFGRGIDRIGIRNFIISKLDDNDPIMLNFFKNVLRSGDQKRGLQNFINEVLKDKKNLIGIQLGSFCGQSTQMFLNSGVFSKLYTIDSYDGDKIIDYAQKIFIDRFMNNDKIVKIKKLTSQAVKCFEDDSIDFIYIDANHEYEFVKSDIINYLPKLKKGGIMAGHDYTQYWQSVINAVNEIFGKPIKVFQDSSWYVIK